MTFSMFQASTGSLWLREANANGSTDVSDSNQSLPMAGATSPSIATTWNPGVAPEGPDGIGLVGYQTSNGEPIIAFQGGNGDLVLLVNGTAWDQGLAMAEGTSPSMGMFPPGSLSGSGAVAYQANSLFVLEGNSHYNHRPRDGPRDESEPRHDAEWGLRHRFPK
jgi:hypothetical protein